MTQAVQRYQPTQALAATNVAELEQLGRMAAASGFFSDAKEAAQAMVKIAAGQELGLPPIMSMTSINVIKGRVTLSANLMAALLKRAGYRIKVTWEGNTACTVTVWDAQGNECGDSSFSLDDAKQAGLAGDNWKKFPRNMLYARAVSNAARWYAPEVLTGCYLPDEMDAVDMTPRDPQPAQPTRPHTDPVVEMDVVESEPEPELTVTAVDSLSPKASARSMKKLHAVAAKRGITHDQLRDLVGVESMTECTSRELDALTGTIEGWNDDIQAIALQLIKAVTLDELKTAWTALGKANQAELEAAKDFRKARINRYMKTGEEAA